MYVLVLVSKQGLKSLTIRNSNIFIPEPQTTTSNHKAVKSQTAENTVHNHTCDACVHLASKAPFNILQEDEKDGSPRFCCSFYSEV